MATMKKVLYSLTTMKFRDWVRFSRLDFAARPPVLVFQMGKVGSTSIYHTLDGMNLGRPVYHAHYLSSQGVKKARKWHRLHQGKVPYGVEYYQLLGRKIRRNLGEAHYTVIAGVRDPIAKEISNYFELADEVDHGLRDEDGSFDTSQIISYLLDRFRRFDVEEDSFFTTAWFDQELKGTLGIDIYEYPFDHSQGYSIFRCADLDLLVYQYERLGEIFRYALSELLGLSVSDIPELRRDNVGTSKWYADLYTEAKDAIVIPAEVCKKVYGTEFVRHFYSDETIDEWIEHWSGRSDLQCVRS